MSGLAVLEAPNRVSRPGQVAVVCAGTSDLPVAEEAAVTIELAGGVYSRCTLTLISNVLSGYDVVRLADVGVAGIHRLLHNVSIIENADVVVCVAGMDGGKLAWVRTQC